jgi:hypothetical protein
VNDAHLSDDALSSLVDAPDAPEQAALQAHLAGCSRCEQRLSEVRSVVEMLHGLAELEPPRSFALGPRSVGAPANVVRLRRWYVATRALGASLAAIFVLLVGGATYLDLSVPPPSQPARTALAPASEPESAPQAPAAPAAPPTPAGAVAARPQPQRAAAPAGDQATPSTDQVIATTAVRPLPTQTPAGRPGL